MIDLYRDKYLYNFVKESNAIEKIFREPLQSEIDELGRFISLPEITVEQLEKFVSIYEPSAKMRDQYGMNVRIGSYYPPFGSPDMRNQLALFLKESDKWNAYLLHIFYEKIHPFTDCNGRSGRALWLWKHQNIEESFLLKFYYQALDYHSKIGKI